MMKHFYAGGLVLVFLCASSQAEVLSIDPTRSKPNGPTATGSKVHPDVLETPEISWGSLNGNRVSLDIYNPNQSGSTEVYRSQDGSPFVLVATLPYNEYSYVDSNLKQRTTFGYRLRAVSGTEVSAFSNIVTFTTYSLYYPPIVTAKALDAYTIELTITDRTYYDLAYEISGVGETHENDFWQNFNMPDSGSTLKLIHHPASAGMTYKYSLIVFPEDPEASYFEETDIAIVTTPRDANCTTTGAIERERWDNIPGYGVSLIPTYNYPNLVTTLSSFSTPANEGNNYGARVRGFVCAPQTGDYVFWISSDDNSELWLSTDERPMNKRLIASSKWTYPNEWNKYTTQQSVPIHLESGKKYYIEALHKENAGADHLAVGWKLPSGALERPIPGNRLSKMVRGNYPPHVVITNPKHGTQYEAPASILVTATASDPDGSVARVDFYIDGVRRAQDYTAPYEYQWNNIPAGEYTIYATAIDNQGASNTYGASIYVKDPPQCVGTGKITREYWYNIEGTTLSSANFNVPPNYVTEYSSFETESKSYYDNYASRMRGYVCVPVTGNYTFFISSDDQSQLFLSTDENPANKKLIASVPTYTGYRVYNKFASQKSVPLALVGGRKYYIEALHKEGKGYDFVSVAWQLPNGTMQQPIPGDRLINLENVLASRPPTVTITSPVQGQQFTTFPATITAKVSASDPDPNGAIVRIDFYLDGALMGTDNTAPYELTMSNIARGQHEMLVRAFDNSQTTNIDVVTFVVESANVSCAGAGKISREVWTGVPGITVAEIPLNEPPDQVSELTSFETSNYFGNDYGQRIRGYVCPARTGEYIFYIASDDASELWLSTDDSPANKKKIAYLNTAVTTRNWFTPRPEQSSDWIQLTAGTKYYIEALHKEGRGDDHLSVAWRFEDYSVEGPIGGDKLLPFTGSSSASLTMVSSEKGESEMIMSEEEEDEISLYPNPTSTRQITISMGNMELANPRVEIVSATGKIIQAQDVNCDGCSSIEFMLDNSVTQGLYLVNVVSNRRRLTKKLQVK
jgi:hypothetical protein